jgi:hypothetical protein
MPTHISLISIMEAPKKLGGMLLEHMSMIKSKLKN